LALLIKEKDVVAASHVINATRVELLADEINAIGISAGVAAVEPGATLEGAVNEAGRLLYLAQASASPGIVSNPEQLPLPTTRILVAEDDEVLAKLLVHRLTREPGFVVTHCVDGSEALRTAQSERFDMAILDVHMPGIGGFDLLGRLREMPEYAEVPIVMLTALGSEKDVVRGLELGASDYVVKPFSPLELIARVRRLAGRAS
jgi:PleD family two-component response regulator